MTPTHIPLQAFIYPTGVGAHTGVVCGVHVGVTFLRKILWEYSFSERKLLIARFAESAI